MAPECEYHSVTVGSEGMLNSVTAQSMNSAFSKMPITEGWLGISCASLLQSRSTIRKTWEMSKGNTSTTHPLCPCWIVLVMAMAYAMMVSSSTLPQLIAFPDPTLALKLPCTMGVYLRTHNCQSSCEPQKHPSMPTQFGMYLYTLSYL